MLCEHNILHQNSIQAQDEWVVEVANNNIKKILQKIMDTIKIGMRNFVCIARLSNIYSFFHLGNIIFFVYGMEAVLQVEEKCHLQK